MGDSAKENPVFHRLKREFTEFQDRDQLWSSGSGWESQDGVSTSENAAQDKRQTSSVALSVAKRSLLHDGDAAQQAEKDRFAHYSALLRDWGFTGTQLVLIADAMTEAGLRLVEAETAHR